MRLNWLKCENKGNWMQRRLEATPDTPNFAVNDLLLFWFSMILSKRRDKIDRTTI